MYKDALKALERKFGQPQGSGNSALGQTQQLPTTEDAQ